MTTETQQQNDLEIRQRLEAGQYSAAFERIVELFSEKIFHLALSMVNNPSVAEDLAQDVLVKVWKNLPNYKGTASVSTWIYVISRNTCLTELKKRATRPTVSLQDPEIEHALSDLPDLQSSGRETGAEMDAIKLLQELPEKYRQIITLYYLEQKSYEELSALLGLPLGTVKTYLFRARKQLLQISQRAPKAAILKDSPYVTAST